MAGGDARIGRAAERGVEDRVAGLGQRGSHRGDTHVGDGSVREPTEGMESHPGDPHVGHAGVNV